MLRVAGAPRHDGPTMILSSRRNLAPLSTRPTSGVPSAKWPSTLGSERKNGHHKSCGTVSSRCCRAQGFRSRTSRIWSATQHRTTEKVYRKELRPVLRRGAKAMDDLFKAHY